VKFIYLLLSITSINFIIFKNLKKISKFINLYDKPNKKRKIHSVPIPSIGGIILVINLVLVGLINVFFKILDFNYLVFFFYALVIFFIALIDDILDILPYKKFFLISLVIFFFLLFNNDKLISRIIFDFYYLSIENYFISFFITWLCVMLLMNALNLYDGVNGQLATYAIFVFAIFLYKNIFFDLSFFILFFLLFFLYNNLRGRIFLGDNGSFLIGFVIAFIVISNNSTANYLTSEKIFLLMFLPGMDMFRLFVERLIKRQNPFTADSSHIHHLFIKKFSQKNLLFFNILVYSLPIILSYSINNLLLIVILIIFYLLFIYKYLGHTLKK
jgi:UDP-GlcNAc:undecaprenyl-phosphate GlcNAc-1-phosphate transferase